MYGIVKTGTTELLARFTAPLTVRSNQPVFSSDTLSMAREVVRRSNQRWEIDAGLEPLVGGANELFAHLAVNGSSEKIEVKMPQNYAVQMSLEDGFSVDYTSVTTVSGGKVRLAGSFSQLVSAKAASPEGTFPDIVSVNSDTLEVSATTPRTTATGEGSVKLRGLGRLQVNAAAKASTSVTTTAASGYTRNVPVGCFIKFSGHDKIYMVRGHTGNTIDIFPALNAAVASNSELYWTNVSGSFRYDTDVISGMVYSDGILMSTGNVKLVEAI